MTYYGPQELAAAFRTVRKNTIQIAEEIPEDKYSFRPAPSCRSVAETLTHMAMITRIPKQIHFVERLNNLAGFDFFGLMGALEREATQARSKAEIIDLLRREGEEFAALLDGASEAFVAETIAYPPGMTPPTKSRFEMLMAAKEHEMHHRGQLMVVQRMIGITPHLTRQMEQRVAELRAATAAKH
jgi:uncharacterized damage-inducible protein DinB